LGASTLEFDSTVGGGQTAGFTGGGGALDLLDPLGFAAKISGFAATDKIELSGDWVLSSFSETGNGNMGMLTLSSGSNLLSLHFLGDLCSRRFHHRLGSDHDNRAHMIGFRPQSLRALSTSVLIGKDGRFSAPAATENRRGPGRRRQDDTRPERAACSLLVTPPRRYVYIHYHRPAGRSPGVNRES
jgi:hypothetical protein